MRALSKSQIVLIYFVFFLALALRLINISQHGLWSDEKISVLISQGITFLHPIDVVSIKQSALAANNNFSKIVECTITDNGNSIAYNILLHYWIELFGCSDFAVRALSLVFSMATLIVLFLFSFKKFGTNIGIIVLVLFSVNPLSIAYANEARAYSMGIFLAISASVIFWDLTHESNSEKPIAKASLYGFLAGLALLTHYLTAAVFLGHIIYAFFYLRTKSTWLYLLYAGVLTSSIFITWMFLGGLKGLKIMQFQQVTFYQKMFEVENSYVIPSSLRNILTGIIQMWLQEMGNYFQAFFRVRQIAVMFLFPILVIAFALLKKSIEKKNIHLFLIIFFTQTLFAVTVAIKDKHTVSLQPVYSNFAAPHFMLIFCLALFAIYKSNKKVGIALIIIQLIIQSVSVYGHYQDIPKKREINPYPLIAKNISEQSKAADRIIHCSNWKDVYMLYLYLPTNKDYCFVIDQSNPDFITVGIDTKIVSPNLRNIRY